MRHSLHYIPKPKILNPKSHSNIMVLESCRGGRWLSRAAVVVVVVLPLLCATRQGEHHHHHGRQSQSCRLRCSATRLSLWRSASVRGTSITLCLHHFMKLPARLSADDPRRPKMMDSFPTKDRNKHGSFHSADTCADHCSDLWTACRSLEGGCRLHLCASFLLADMLNCVKIIAAVCGAPLAGGRAQVSPARLCSLRG